MATQFAIKPTHSAVENAKTLECLIRQNAGLVTKIAWQVYRRVSSAIDVDDLIQMGMIALIEAARDYEDRGYAFSTYASLRVRGSMIDGLRRQSLQCRSAMVKRRMIERARSRFEHCEGRAPSDSDLAEALNMDLSAFRIDASACQPPRHEPIDALYSDRSLAFADQAEAADVLLDRSRTRDAVAAAIRTLPEREAQVLQMYFVEERALEDIGMELGIGAPRVCQIKKAALDRLRGMLQGRD